MNRVVEFNTESFKAEGLPFPTLIRSSSHSGFTGHDLRAGPFAGIESLDIGYQKADDLKFLQSAFNVISRNKYTMGNETEVTSTLSVILETVSQMFGDEFTIGMEKHFIMTDGKRKKIDLLIARSTSALAVIEVKFPCDNPNHRESQMDNEVAIRQLVNYMSILRSVHGMEHVIGILTTYAYWRGFFFKDSVAFMQEKHSPASYFKPCEELALPSVMQSSAPSEFVSYDDDVPNNEVFGTVAVAYNSQGGNGPKFCEFLTTLITKMLCAPTSSFTFHNPRILTAYNRDTGLFAAVNFVLPRLTLRFTVPALRPEENLLFVIKQLGVGRDGHAYLVSNKRGEGFVIKIFSNRDGRTTVEELKIMAEREQVIYNHVWCKSALSFKTTSQTPYLAIPYVQTFKESTDKTICLGDLLISREVGNPHIDAVIKAIQQFASNGYLHSDLRWRHVGIYTNEHSELVAILIDLSEVEVINDKNEESENAAVARMKMMLGIESYDSNVNTRNV